MFQSYLSEYSILEVETFRMYSYMIELSAHVRRRYGHMRVSLDGTSNLILFSNFHFFPPAWVTRLGVTANVRNINFLCVLYIPIPNIPVRMKGLPCLV